MTKRTILDAAWYLAVFAMLQIGVAAVTGILMQGHDMTPGVATVTALVTNGLAIALFAWRKWCPVGGQYINSRPWPQLAWVVCLALGSSVPLAFMVEEAGLQMPDQLNGLFTGIIHHPLGYMAVCLVAPVAEEMVFRGAILRRLLELTGHSLRWVAIAVTALLFGVIHGNMAQGLTAFVMGLVIGWLYVRTRSIVPCVALHVADNSMSYAVCRLIPGSENMTVRQLYGGDMTHVWLAVLFSLMIFGAALYQLNMQLGHERQK